MNIRQPDGIHAVEQTDVYKYLSIWLDPHVTFGPHIDKVCSKVKARSGILWCMHSFISQSLAYELHTRLIHPHFTYGDIIYDGSSKAAKSKLQRHQNMALRAVLNMDKYSSSSALHETLDDEWLDVSRQRFACNLAYKAIVSL